MLAEILHLHLRDEQLDEDVDLHNIPTLCVSAAMASVKDSVDNLSWTSPIPCKSGGAANTPHQNVRGWSC
ncbi:hypothetical protein PILCRDRAFT_812333 [Piloderma croceum F 1598]|uniref:Uncharacterized protein n=1 Tax=Piloderma croceum (strain F 1598) TaxID=765440 RepID=A0A0C3BVK8_PILCF|nr:hypothetical protein PILCRDRAFT_812333 [Piloderma croceum F 1598]